MAYTVKIVYKGVEQEVDKLVAPICRCYLPANSYIDTPVYTEGHPVGEETKDYGKSVYATNVDGFGEIPVQEPYATTSVPFSVALAQFKVAAVADEKDENGFPFVEFEVDDYKEGFYYKSLGKELADQGFEVTVTKKA